MHTILCRLLIVVTLMVPMLASAEDDPVAASRELYGEAMAARSEGNHAEAVRLLRESVALRPHHPTLIYALAMALVPTGDPVAVALQLALLADMGVRLEPEELAPFDTLASDPAIIDALRMFPPNAREIGESEPVVTFASLGYIPESVAYDPASDAYFVGSVHQRTIVRIQYGEAETFASRLDGLWSVFGLKVDTARNLLWACTSATPNADGIDSTDAGKSGLIYFDLTTGEAKGRYLVEGGEGPAWLGDLVLATDGTIYATDSVRNVIMVLRPDSDSLQVFSKSPDYASLQGLDLSADERVLYVADYSRGIHRVDLATGTSQVLEYPARTCLLGIDGLYRHGNALIAIQNGMSPHRIVRAQLADDGQSITKVSVLAANDPRWDEPTLGMLRDDALIFVCNSQWGLFARDGSLPGDADFKDPLVLKLNLP